MKGLMKNVFVLAVLPVLGMACSNQIPDEVQPDTSSGNSDPNYTLIAENLVSTLGMLDSITVSYTHLTLPTILLV